MNKPPVIQTWIGFKFAAGVEKPTWNLDNAGRFLGRYEDHLPGREAIIETTFEIQPFSNSRLARQVSHQDRLDRARAHNQSKSHWLQLADDHMVYNQTREKSYLGFESLRDEALDKLSDYVQFFRPSSLAAVELHYVDLIEIPKPPDGRIDLQEYFNLRVEMPDIFGMTWQFSTQLFVQPQVGNSLLEVKLQSVAPDEETGAYRFRLDWNFICLNLESWDREAVRTRLDQAHTCLLDYFRASVTERTWQLFQPSDEG